MEVFFALGALVVETFVGKNISFTSIQDIKQKIFSFSSGLINKKQRLLANSNTAQNYTSASPN